MKVSFIGIGSAFSTLEENTSAYIKKDNKMLLIDCGETTARSIIKNNILEGVEELYILISHTHSDHIGSIGTLLFYSRYRKNILSKLVLPDDEEYINNIKEYLSIIEITDEVDYVDSETVKTEFDLKEFKFLKATHTDNIPCYGFVLEDDENITYYTGDNSNLDYIRHYIQYDNSIIYTEICNDPNLQNQHLYLPYLEEILSMDERKRVFLMHIDESLNIDDLKQKGFNIPEKQKSKKI